MSTKKFAEILMTCIKPRHINLGRTDIFIMLSLPVHEHMMSLQVFKFSFFRQHFIVFIIEILYIFVRLYLSVLLGAIVTSIAFLISVQFVHCQYIGM